MIVIEKSISLAKKGDSSDGVPVDIFSSCLAKSVVTEIFSISFNSSADEVRFVA